MSDYLTFKKDIAETYIKLTKRAIKYSRAMYYISLTLFAMNVWAVYMTPSRMLNAICAGAMFMNMLWQLTELSSHKHDRDVEIDFLKHLKELYATEEYERMTERLEKQKQLYEKALQAIKDNQQCSQE